MALGIVPNNPTESNVPINTWEVLLVGQTPLLWTVTLDDMEGRQYTLWKSRVNLVYPVNMEPAIGDVIQLSINQSDAQDAGLLPPTLSQDGFLGGTVIDRVRFGPNPRVGPLNLPVPLRPYPFVQNPSSGEPE
jgi:hypothetical protein